MAEGKRELFGVELPTETIGDTEIVTIEGANLNKLKDRLGLNQALREVRCNPVVGCGREIPAEEFGTWDQLSIKEFAMSGLCKTPCQDKFYADPDDRKAGDPCTCEQPCCEVDVGVGVVTCNTQHCPVHGTNAWHTGNDGPTPPNDDLIPEELVV